MDRDDTIIMNAGPPTLILRPDRPTTSPWAAAPLQTGPRFNPAPVHVVPMYPAPMSSGPWQVATVRPSFAQACVYASLGVLTPVVAGALTFALLVTFVG